MVRFMVGCCVALLSAGSSAAGIKLQCDEYVALVEPQGLTVNGRLFANPQEKPYDISAQYTGRALIYTDGQDQNSDTNWAAIHIITQLETGKKVFFYADSKHTNDKAIICTREQDAP
ncbi:hypothetical protein [Enterobacter sp. Bisph1]|uniref:hypothetical protein n=1 Tax=Enterobacter sp. Bisph1 TaxID=1274399 RepID=UPI000A98BD36|nr:hypothetical protein [Enterobacter sp. Bisph1]